MNSLKVKVNELPVPAFVAGVAAASPCRGPYPIRGTLPFRAHGPSHRWSYPLRSRGATRDALLPFVLGRAFKGEL